MEEQQKQEIVQEEQAWKWSYSRWLGIMYGPIPVGVIVVGIGLIIYYAAQ